MRGECRIFFWEDFDKIFFFWKESLKIIVSIEQCEVILCGVYAFLAYYNIMHTEPISFIQRVSDKNIL